MQRNKTFGRLKQEWSSFDDYLKMAYWYLRIPLGHQVTLLWCSRIPSAVQGLTVKCRGFNIQVAKFMSNICFQITPN